MNNLIETTFDFKGAKYKVASLELGDHPSFHGFNFDEISIRDQLWDIKSGDYVLDVGACYGSYTLTALAAGASKVYAWSPQSHGLLSDKEVLEQSLILNGWEDKCVVYDNGVYYKSGWLDCFEQRFFDHEPQNYVKNTITNVISDIIKVDTLNNWYEQEFLPNVKNHINNKRIWIKIDVEGGRVRSFIRRFQIIKRT